MVSSLPTMIVATNLILQSNHQTLMTSLEMTRQAQMHRRQTIRQTREAFPRSREEAEARNQRAANEAIKRLIPAE